MNTEVSKAADGIEALAIVKGLRNQLEATKATLAKCRPLDVTERAELQKLRDREVGYQATIEGLRADVAQLSADLAGTMQNGGYEYFSQQLCEAESRAARYLHTGEAIQKNLSRTESERDATAELVDTVASGFEKALSRILAGDPDGAQRELRLAIAHVERDDFTGASMRKLRARVTELEAAFKDPVALRANILRHLPGYDLMSAEYVGRLTRCGMENDQLCARVRELEQDATRWKTLTHMRWSFWSETEPDGCKLYVVNTAEGEFKHGHANAAFDAACGKGQS